MTVEQLFTCRFCEQVKPIEEMQRDTTKKHGVQYRCKECRRKQRAENGEYSREKLRKYSYRKGDDFIYITVDELETLMQKCTCSYCGCTMTDNSNEQTAATVDHVYTIGLGKDYGGANIVENIVPACKSCNSSKRTDHIYDFYCRSEKFTEELWTQFVRDYGERLIKRNLSDIEVEHMKRNFADEADDLRRNAKRKAVSTG